MWRPVKTFSSPKNLEETSKYIYKIRLEGLFRIDIGAFSRFPNEAEIVIPYRLPFENIEAVTLQQEVKTVPRGIPRTKKEKREKKEKKRRSDWDLVLEVGRYEDPSRAEKEPTAAFESLLAEWKKLQQESSAPISAKALLYILRNDKELEKAKWYKQLKARGFKSHAAMMGLKKYLLANGYKTVTLNGQKFEIASMTKLQ